MSKLLLIDGNAIIHRAYHAMPALTTKDNKPAGAVYGFINMLLRVIQDLEPTHIAVCFDRPEPTFRKEIFKEYQSHRPEMDEDLGVQFATVKSVLEAMNIPVFDKAGYEADDLIGTLAKKGKNKVFDQVIIVTGDKDILQLVDDKVKVYLPIRGLSNAKLFGKKEVKEKLGVEPEQIVDLKALMGDPSDNYPGVFGIGPKTAIKLLQKYKSFPDIYKNLNSIEDNIAKKLQDGKENGEISYKLARINTEVDFEYDLDNMVKWRIDSVEVISLFEDLGFKTPIKRVMDVAAKINTSGQDSLF